MRLASGVALQAGRALGDSPLQSLRARRFDIQAYIDDAAGKRTDQQHEPQALAMALSGLPSLPEAA